MCINKHTKSNKKKGDRLIYNQHYGYEEIIKDNK